MSDADKNSSKTKCDCEFCTKWNPWMLRVEKRLNGKNKKLFKAFALRFVNDSEQLSIAQSKLQGTWPGWDWIIEAKKKHAHFGR